MFILLALPWNRTDGWNMFPQKSPKMMCEQEHFVSPTMMCEQEYFVSASPPMMPLLSAYIQCNIALLCTNWQQRAPISAPCTWNFKSHANRSSIWLHAHWTCLVCLLKSNRGHELMFQWCMWTSSIIPERVHISSTDMKPWVAFDKSLQSNYVFPKDGGCWVPFLKWWWWDAWISEEEKGLRRSRSGEDWNWQERRRKWRR